MWHLIAATAQQVTARSAALVFYVKTASTALGAVVAVLAGVATLNLAVAESGLVTLNQLAKPALQLVRIGKES